MSSRPGLGKRVAFAVALAAGVWLLAELAGWAAFWALDGRPLSYQRLARQRRAVERPEAPPELGGDALKVPRVIASEVIHPFLGFVFDADLDAETDRRFPRLRITEQGFLRSPKAAPAGEGEPYRIGVFGGSVAFLFSMEGVAVLPRELAGTPALAGRPVVVDSFALGGYKQPQQLAALTYLLALGERFDVVVNLDGFNDLVLTDRENYERGVYPAYPRRWPQRVRRTVEPEEVLQAGEIAYLRRLRGELAAGAERPLLRRSPLWNLLWWSRDRALAARIAAREEEIGAGPAGERRFESHGPAYPVPEGAARYRQAARLWATSSLQMHRLCAANGIRYYHLLQPNQYVPGSKPMGAAERQRALRDDQPYRPVVEAGYPYLVRRGRELRRQGVAFHDLTQLFADQSEPLYIDDCCHFGRRGSEILGAYLATVLRRDLEAPPAATGAQ